MLPAELVYHIGSYLNYIDCVSLGQTCKYLYWCCQDILTRKRHREISLCYTKKFYMVHSSEVCGWLYADTTFISTFKNFKETDTFKYFGAGKVFKTSNYMVFISTNPLDRSVPEPQNTIRLDKMCLSVFDLNKKRETCRFELQETIDAIFCGEKCFVYTTHAAIKMFNYVGECLMGLPAANRRTQDSYLQRHKVFFVIQDFVVFQNALDEIELKSPTARKVFVLRNFWELVNPQCIKLSGTCFVVLFESQLHIFKFVNQTTWVQTTCDLHETLVDHSGMKINSNVVGFRASDQFICWQIDIQKPICQFARPKQSIQVVGSRLLFLREESGNGGELRDVYTNETRQIWLPDFDTCESISKNLCVLCSKNNYTHMYILNLATLELDPVIPQDGN